MSRGGGTGADSSVCGGTASTRNGGDTGAGSNVHGGNSKYKGVGEGDTEAISSVFGGKYQGVGENTGAGISVHVGTASTKEWGGHWGRDQCPWGEQQVQGVGGNTEAGSMSIGAGGGRGNTGFKGPEARNTPW